MTVFNNRHGGRAIHSLISPRDKYVMSEFLNYDFIFHILKRILVDNSFQLSKHVQKRSLQEVLLFTKQMEGDDWTDGDNDIRKLFRFLIDIRICSTNRKIFIFG